MARKYQNHKHLLRFTMQHQVTHGECVSSLAYELAKELGLNEEKCKNMAIAGFFHDIGKAEIIREQDGKNAMVVEEMNSVREHPQKSYDILKRHGYNEEICEAVLYHHENYDGTGYPKNLRGWSIPLGACILRVCDVFCALVEDRPYRSAFTPEQAVNMMIHEIKHYDLKVFLAFQRVLHREGEEICIPEARAEVKGVWKAI